MALSVYVILYGLPLAAILLAAVKLVSLLHRRRQLQEKLRAFPGPPAHWWYGNVRELAGNYEGMQRMASLANDFHGAFPVWVGPFDAFLVSVHPSTAKVLLSGADPKDEFSYSLMRPWIGEGLLLSKGTKWDRNRRLMSPAFHTGVIKEYVDTFNKTSDALVDKWTGICDQGPLEMFQHVSLLTMDSMLQALFGAVTHCQESTTRHPYVQAVYDVSDLIVKRIISPLLHNDVIYYLTRDGRDFKKACQTIHDFSREVIVRRKKLLQTEKPGERTKDFLDILLTAKDTDGCGLSDQEIQDEVDTFMFEGYDSTSSGLSWCLYHLAANPDFQDRVRQEANDVIGDKTYVSWENLNKMEFSLRCIRESMRLLPPVVNISRFTEKEIKLPDGRVIPKGIRVAVSLFALHRNPEVWSEPEVFDPTRFSDDSGASSTFYLPFSLGPRNCIGMNFALTQLRLAVPKIIQNFQLTVVPERPAIPETLLILRSKNGVYLKAEKIPR